MVQLVVLEHVHHWARFILRLMPVQVQTPNVMPLQQRVTGLKQPKQPQKAHVQMPIGAGVVSRCTMEVPVVVQHVLLRHLVRTMVVMLKAIVMYRALPKQSAMVQPLL